MAKEIVQSQNINVCSKLTTGNPVNGATRLESDGAGSNPTTVHIGSWQQLAEISPFGPWTARAEDIVLFELPIGSTSALSNNVETWLITSSWI